MGRKATGSIDERNGRWYVRLTVTLPDGKKVRRRVPRDGYSTRAAAEAFRDRQRGKLGAVGVAGLGDPTMSVRRYVEDLWLPSREERKFRAVNKNRQRLALHVLPVIGDLAMRDVDEDILRELVERLDDKARDPKLKFGWAMARVVWVTTRKLFTDAVKGKQRKLRILTHNPALNVAGPDEGADKSLQWLYPVEFSRLMACPEVPVRWRRIYAVTVLLMLRAGETQALAWRDLDLLAGTAHVHEQVDERTGEICATKTKDTRDVPLEPTLLPLLRAMRVEAPETERVFGVIYKAARTLREHLLLAGVTRAALHADAETSLPLRFHDLRATGITWLAMRGDSQHLMMARAGHMTLEMTNHYIRRAQLTGGGVGSPFPALPDELVGGQNKDPGSGPESTAGAEIVQRVGDLEGPPQEPRSAESADSGCTSVTDGASGAIRGPLLRRLPPDVQDYVADQLTRAPPAGARRPGHRLGSRSRGGRGAAVMTARQCPAWLPGDPIWYSPTLGGAQYPGVVDSEPRLLGGVTWVVRLRDMASEYGLATGRPGRTTVAAAECELHVSRRAPPADRATSAADSRPERRSGSQDAPRDQIATATCASQLARSQQPGNAARPAGTARIQPGERSGTLYPDVYDLAAAYARVLRRRAAA